MELLRPLSCFTNLIGQLKLTKLEQTPIYGFWLGGREVTCGRNAESKLQTH